MKLNISNINIVKQTFIFVILTSLMSCGKQSNVNFNVEGKLQDLSLTTLYAVREISRDSLVIDTILVKKPGEFMYEGEISTPTLVSLFYSDSLPPLQFFLEKGYNVQIKGDAIHPTSIEIKGGSINDDLNDFRKKNANLLLAKERAFSKKDHFDPAELKNINFQLARSVRDYVEKNPEKIASVLLMNEYSIDNIAPDLLSHDIALLKGDAAEFYQTTLLKEYYDKVKGSSVGAPAPNITLNNTRGKSVSLNDFRGKNVLLIFDLKESPANESYFTRLKETQKKLKNKIDFISIVVDENVDSPDPEVIKIANSLDWTVLLDCQKWNSKEVKKYNVTTAPYMILISPDGTIVERDVSLDSLLISYK